MIFGFHTRGRKRKVKLLTKRMYFLLRVEQIKSVSQTFIVYGKILLVEYDDPISYW